MTKHSYSADIAMALLSVAGLMGSCLIACLIAVVIMVRAPFQFVAWLLGKVIEGAGVLCMLLEGL